MIDMSQQYAHHNVGGAILWGMQQGPGETDFPTTNIQTFRVMANDEYATVRIQTGDVTNPIPDNSGVITDTVVYEVTIIPGGINADSGDLASSAAAKSTTYRYTIDKSGNLSMAVLGDAFHYYAKTLTISVVESFTLSGEADGAINFQNGLTINGGSFVTIKGKLINLGSATQAIARKGDFVTIPANGPAGVPMPCMIVFPTTPAASGPCTLQWLMPIGGAITTGNDAIKG
jgi:hypothetical protein